jgi:hypothetical protein
MLMTARIRITPPRQQTLRIFSSLGLRKAGIAVPWVTYDYFGPYFSRGP